MEKQTHDSITEAQSAAMEELRMLMKDSTSEAGKYSFDYTSAAFATTAIRPLLLKHGITSHPISVTHQGRYGNGVGVDMIYTFRYLLKGRKAETYGIDYVDVPILGSGKVGNSGDKSAFAALTTTQKYADLAFLRLPMVDDIESFTEAADKIEQAYETGEIDEKDASPAPKKKKKAVKAPSSGVKKQSRKSRVKKLKTKKEEEPEEEPAELKSLDYNVGEGKKIVDMFVEEADSEEEAAEAIAEFIQEEVELGEDHSSYRITMIDYATDVLQDLLGEPEPEELEEEEPEESTPTQKTSSTDQGILDHAIHDDYVDVDLIDYDDPDQVDALFEIIDITDGQIVNNAFDAFEDVEQLKSFYNAIYDRMSEESQEQAEAFTENHFPHLQECVEALVN